MNWAARMRICWILVAGLDARPGRRLGINGNGCETAAVREGHEERQRGRLGNPVSLRALSNMDDCARHSALVSCCHPPFANVTIFVWRR